MYDEEFPLTLSSAKYICTHEFGHAVGYLGHSPMMNDVMYYTVINSELTLSVRDITHLTYINSLLE